MLSFDKNDNNFGEVDNLPLISETSRYGTKTFRPQNKEQYELYLKSKDSNRQSFYFVAIYGLILFISFCIIIIGHIMINFFLYFPKLNKIIYYLDFLWLLCLFLFLYESNRLDNINFNLRCRVEKEMINDK